MAKRKHTTTNADTLLNQEIAHLRGQIAIELAARSNASGMNISLGDINEEYVPELKSIKGRMKVYERMANDPWIRGQLRGIGMTLISGVRWKMDGGTQEQKDLVGANLLRQGPPKWWCSTSFYDRLHETLGMLIYGFAMFALTREIVEDKMIYRHIKWLHPRSVDENGWVMDPEDNLLYVRRSFQDATGKAFSMSPIPAEDMFLACWDRRGPNWEGNAFIRPMYKNWKIGEVAEKIDIIDLQNRGIAIPVAKLSGAGGPKERDTLVEILRTLRGGNKDRAFLVLEKDESIDFLTSQGTAKDASSIIDKQHIGISKVGGSEFSEIGPEVGGGRASTSVLATGFFINIDAVRILIEDMWNFGCGPLPGLCESLQSANFDIEAPRFEYSRISGSRVSPTEQFDNIPLIQDSVKAGLIPPSLKYANETARRLGWPELTQAEFAEGMLLMGKGTPPAVPGRPTQAGADANATRGDQLSQTAPELGKKAPAEVPAGPKAAAIEAFNENHDDLGRFAPGDGGGGGGRDEEVARLDRQISFLTRNRHTMISEAKELESEAQALRDEAKAAEPGRKVHLHDRAVKLDVRAMNIRNRIPELDSRINDAVRQHDELSPTKKATAAQEPSPDPTARRSLRRGAGKRQPTSEENYVLALAQIDNELKSAEARYASRIHYHQRKEIEQIVAKIKEGLDVSSLLKRGAATKLLRYHNQMGNDLKNILNQVRNFGAAQVRDEIKREQAKPGIAAFNENHDEAGRFAEAPGSVSTWHHPDGRKLDVIYIGEQPRPNGKPPLQLYNLHSDIPGHPKDSTVTEETIREVGFTRMPKQKAATEE